MFCVSRGSVRISLLLFNVGIHTLWPQRSRARCCTLCPWSRTAVANHVVAARSSAARALRHSSFQRHCHSSDQVRRHTTTTGYIDNACKRRHIRTLVPRPRVYSSSRRRWYSFLLSSSGVHDHPWTMLDDDGVLNFSTDRQ